jgi:Right handed beta helix region
MKIIAGMAVGLALVGIISITPAQAQATRTFVSPTGNDAAACSLAAPCRTFLAAYALTNAGGEIAVLGTAGYGPLTISKAISIVNGGGFEAGVSVPSSGIGITINATTNDAVSLRGLTIDGAGVGATGIKFNTGKSLTVENCVIRHMTGDGIEDFSTTATSALTVSNSLVADNSSNGIILAPTGSATAVFNRVEVNNNAIHGILVAGIDSAGTNTVNATVSESVAARNGNDGFFSTTTLNNAPTSVMVFHSVAANNGTGVETNGTGATLRLANSIVTGNASGWVASGGAVLSDGDNTIEGNGANQGAPTTYARK